MTELKNNIFKKIGSFLFSEAADLVTEEKSTRREMLMFTYKEAISYCREMHEKIPQIEGCRISIRKESDCTEALTPDDKWLIRQVFYDANGQPFPHSSGSGFYGRIVLADAVDMAFSRLMNGQNDMVITFD